MLDAIKKRRSIRIYRDEPVSGEMIEVLLRSGMQAPSARNIQPWEFVVSTSRKLMEKIPDIHPYSQMVPSAGAIILVCGDTDKQPEIGYILEDCSAAVQNILLEAVNQELGAVWLGVYPREERVKGISELFGLPSHIIPVALLSIGFPGEEKEFDDRFKPERVHKDRW
jgi:nitroreductase